MIYPEDHDRTVRRLSALMNEIASLYPDCADIRRAMQHIADAKTLVRFTYQKQQADNNPNQTKLGI